MLDVKTKINESSVQCSILIFLSREANVRSDNGVEEDPPSLVRLPQARGLRSPRAVAPTGCHGNQPTAGIGQ